MDQSWWSPIKCGDQEMVAVNSCEFALLSMHWEDDLSAKGLLILGLATLEQGCWTSSIGRTGHIPNSLREHARTAATRWFGCCYSEHHVQRHGVTVPLHRLLTIILTPLGSICSCSSWVSRAGPPVKWASSPPLI